MSKFIILFQNKILINKIIKDKMKIAKKFKQKQVRNDNIFVKNNIKC